MAVFSNIEYDQHETLHFVSDPQTGLRAIISVHSTALGPAMGGTRMWAYNSDADALTDVLRLSRGMSYKNAMANLPIGGGKAVIIGDAKKDKSPALFRAFGRAVENLNGMYITAEDVGITESDMMAVAQVTSYVSGLPKERDSAAAGGDPSPKTARGVFHGIRAAVRHTMQRNDLEGIEVAVQGLGSVGYKLCEELVGHGAKVVVADVNAAAVERACDELKARSAPVESILFQPVDVVAPCALGGVLNHTSIPIIQAPIIAGGANNQLATSDDGAALLKHGILYAPDYVINAGGIISAAAEYLESMSEGTVWNKVAEIENRLLQIFEIADTEQRSTHAVADDMARQKILAQSNARLAA